MANKVSFGNGAVPQLERWPFSGLKPGHYFQCDDITKHASIRSAASRARKRLKKDFSVHKVKLMKDGAITQVIRVYLNVK